MARDGLRDRALLAGARRARRRRRRPGRGHRTEPSGAVLELRGAAGARRGAGAGLRGLGGRGDELRARARRRPLRGLRGPGAGRQGAVDHRRSGRPGARAVRRAAGPARLRPGARARGERGAGARRRRARGRSGAGGRVARRHRRARPGRHVRDDVHLGHDGPAQGRHALAPEPDRDLSERERVRLADRARGDDRVPAARLGRGPRVQLHPVADRRLLGVLPRERGGDHRVPARDRADLLLRPGRGCSRPC